VPYSIGAPSWQQRAARLGDLGVFNPLHRFIRFR